jgi:ABC-type polysaccharide/polyol phosphate export permease
MLSNLQDSRPASALAVPPTVDLIPAIVGSESRSVSIIAEELIAGFRAWPVWVVMGWDDIRQRYRRSVLGPFWITLSMGVFILLLGLIYSRLFNAALRNYLPFLTVGYVVWGFISVTTNEACNLFHESSRIIKQIKLPFSIYAMRVIWRNFIVFLHTAAIYIPVAIFFRVAPTPTTLLAIPGLFLMLLNQFWITMVVGILATRYRDMVQIVATAIQLMMFATPIMWITRPGGNLQFVADINPLYHFIEIVRAPLLGTSPQPLSWLVAVATAVIGWSLASVLLVRTARRIVYWL